MSVNCGEEAQEETLARSMDLEDPRSLKLLDHRFVSGALVASRRVSGMVCGEGGMKRFVQKRGVATSAKYDV